MNLDFRTTPDHFRDGQAVGDCAKTAHRSSVNFFRQGKDGGAAVEKADGVGLDQADSLARDLALRLGIDSPAIGERDERGIGGGEGAAIGARHLVVPRQGTEIAAGRRRGDAEAGTDLRDGQIPVAVEQLGERLTSRENDRGGNLHSAIGSNGYDWSQSYK